MFDEQPDSDPHGECAAEIHRLEQQVQTLAGLLKRCARCLPPDHGTRKIATEYLREHGFLSPLRTPGVPRLDEPQQENTP